MSDGQICNLESGRRNPTRAVAAACDAAFGAGGALAELAETVRRDSQARGPLDVDSVVAGYERVLENLKDIGRSTGPRFVTPSLRSAARTLTDAGPRTADGQRSDIWLLASRFAEYTGWMAQEAGNPWEALRWTDLAVRWGAIGGDETVAVYALVRKACIAQHRGDLDAAIRFAGQAAGHPAATAAIRAHAARREAQGHALRGDAEACDAAMERCGSHAAEAVACPATPRWGPRIENWNPRLVVASCMLSLRRFETAADLFTAEFRRRPAVPRDNNSQARFAVRRATAMAGVDRLDDACHVIEEVLPVIEQLDSATVRAEVGRFVEQARISRATPGQRALIDASAAVADGRRGVCP